MPKAATYSEVDAMREVDEALAKLEPGAQQRVIDWASSKYKLSANRTPDQGAPSPQIQPGPKGSATPRDIKSFLAQKRPDSFYERVACLVYYLEKFDGKSEVNRKDIDKANVDARLSKLSNSGVFVKNATHTYGYLTSVGKGQLALSTRGEPLLKRCRTGQRSTRPTKPFPSARRPARKAEEAHGIRNDEPRHSRY